jgi:hypothetical protein
MSGDLVHQLIDLSTKLVGNWQYFVDGCLGGIFLELAVLGGLSRLTHARIEHKPTAALYTIACIIGGGIYASRFLGASSDYAAMVEGFSFPITLGALAGRKPGRRLIEQANRQRREKSRLLLRERLERTR